MANVKRDPPLVEISDTLSKIFFDDGGLLNSFHEQPAVLELMDQDEEEDVDVLGFLPGGVLLVTSKDDPSNPGLWVHDKVMFIPNHRIKAITTLATPK